MAMQYRIISVEGLVARVRFHDPEADFVHTRNVNICTNEAGEYDREATRERILSMVPAVVQKMAVGAIADDRKKAP